MPRPLFFKEFGEVVRELRTKRGWSIPQAVRIAKDRKLSLTVAQLTWLEQGRTKNPDPEVLRAIAALYQLSYETLVRDFVAARYDLENGGTESAKGATSNHGGALDVGSDTARVLAEDDRILLDDLATNAAGIIDITERLLARHGLAAFPGRQAPGARDRAPTRPQRARGRRR